MYDKTLKYIPSEILSSVWFISMDKFGAIMQIKDITEDSSEVLEKTYFYQKYVPTIVVVKFLWKLLKSVALIMELHAQ